MLPALVLPATAIIGAFAVGIVAMILKNQAQERKHRERMFMAEKGMEIPRELYDIPVKPKPNGLRAGRAWLMVLGTITIFIGLGVLITLTLRDGFQEGVNGLIPMFIGIGFLAAERLIAIRVVKTDGE